MPRKAGNDPKVTDGEAINRILKCLQNIAFEKVVFKYRMNIDNKASDRLGLVHCFHIIWE